MIKCKETTAISWARHYIEEIMSIELISNMPWGRVHRISNREHVFFLKSTCLERPGEVLLTTALSNLQLHLVPNVIASDQEKGLLLLNDHGGKIYEEMSIDESVKVLHQYAFLQNTTHSSNEVRKACNKLDYPLLFDSFNSWICSKSEMESQFPNTRDKIVEIRAWWEKNKSRIELTLLKSEKLNKDIFFVEHGDLHFRNFAILPSDQIIFYDWSDAIYAPAGFSLPALLGGATATMSKLMTRSEIEIYVQSLSGHDVDLKFQIYQNLPATIVANSMRTLVDFQLFSSVKSPIKKWIAETIKSGISDLASAFSFLSENSNPINKTCFDRI